MRHILLQALIALAGCKNAPTTAAIKEKPVADPLFTSKKVPTTLRPPR
jgi:hypothetical protein